ncbi:hypothetical protein RN001_011414 [Aquatica leii]|uniref:Uncharacterized protein n=1 Tax=Aquatica leii TaxID=1421715 RepID=A0AAN7P2A6_9COLE|nr:hypothetical protein RN001_011414 [Aquatica leii]
MTNYTEINLAKEMIPQYEGGSRNLSFYNNVTNSLTHIKIQIKEKKINRFGDPRNDYVLENNLLTCFQETNENYDTYYEKIKGKLQYLLEHILIHEQDVNLKIYKTNLYTRKALDTFKAGLLEPYRSFISYKNVESLEDCLLQFRNYDNHKQQVSFLNFIRQKTPIKSAHKSNTQNQNFMTPTSRNNAYFNNTNQYNPNYNQYHLLSILPNVDNNLDFSLDELDEILNTDEDRQITESDNTTQHTSLENPVFTIPISENPINYFMYRIIFKLGD